MTRMGNQQPSTLKGEGSTTIPREGSTILDRLEIADIKFISINEITTQHSYVYGIYCSQNDRIYVGSTINLKARISRHLYYLKHNKHHSDKLQRSYNKYSINSLFVLQLEKCEKSYLISKEQYWIDKLDSYNQGFNCSKTALYHRTFKLTKEQIEKRTKKSSIPVICFDLKGKLIQEYSSVADAARGIGDQSTNISSCCKGKLNYVKNFVFIYKKDYEEGKDYSLKKRNYTFSDTHKQRISIANKGRKSSDLSIKALIKRCSIPIFKYDLKGNLISNYSSYKECCENNNLYIKTLKKHILERTPLGEFLYKFSEDIV